MKRSYYITRQVRFCWVAQGVSRKMKIIQGKEAANTKFSQGPSLFRTSADGAPTAAEINIATF